RSAYSSSARFSVGSVLPPLSRNSTASLGGGGPLAVARETADEELPELRVARGGFVEPHFGYELLEVERVAREERDAPLPRIEPDCAGDHLDDTSGIAPAHHPMRSHEPAPLLEGQLVPILARLATLRHGIEAHVGHVGHASRIQPALHVRTGELGCSP